MASPNSIAGTINVKVDASATDGSKKLLSCTPNASNSFFACRNNSGTNARRIRHFSSNTLNGGTLFGTDVSARGMHYNPATNSVVYIK